MTTYDHRWMDEPLPEVPEDYRDEEWYYPHVDDDDGGDAAYDQWVDDGKPYRGWL